MALFHSFLWLYSGIYIYHYIYISHLHYLFLCRLRTVPDCSSGHLGSKTHGNVLAIVKSQNSCNVFAVANEKLAGYQTISFSSYTREGQGFFILFCLFVCLFVLASGWGNMTSSGHWRVNRSDVYLVQAWDLKFLEKSALFLSFRCQLEAEDPKQCSEAYRIQKSLQRWVGPMSGWDVSRDMPLSCYASELLEGELTQEWVLTPSNTKALLVLASAAPPTLSPIGLPWILSSLATLVLRYASASGPLHLLFVVGWVIPLPPKTSMS